MDNRCIRTRVTKHEITFYPQAGEIGRRSEQFWLSVSNGEPFFRPQQEFYAFYLLSHGLMVEDRATAQAPHDNGLSHLCLMELSNRRWDVKHVIASRRRCRVHGCLRGRH
ncbi:hypothetical protein, partial [Mesorhizobium sp. M0203]|uniref:hypothetical protein n=1 Tax=Mesorhizobium sp. M0203 TaxID=2956912 RepID=UPI003338FF1D